MDIKSVTEKIQETVNAPTGAPGGVGVVISMPGTEKVVLDTSLIQLMEYESSEIPSRKRFALIEKGVTARTRRTFVNSRGDRAHIITREVFVLLTTNTVETPGQLNKASSIIPFKSIVLLPR